MPDERTRLIHASGACEIDFGRRGLRVGGSFVPVGGRAFQIIEVLAGSAGELVTKDELLDRIWPGAIVGENTLHVHAGAIRKALGPYRGLLKTESGRGYRLLGDWNARRQHAAAPPVGPQHVRVEAESPVTNFPATVTHLIGPTAAVARLRDLVSAYRAVTLTGPGGIGKTSLALKAARGVLGEFPGGGWLVELASLSDAALVASTAAEVLRLPNGTTGVTPESLAHSIEDKKLLLVLDNCEHLIGAVATLAETLLARCPHTTIIATSREILRIQGEQAYRIPPLEVPASGLDDADHISRFGAVELFIARTKELNSGFSPRAGELPIIGAICRRLDGIPQAIEFAAAQASTLGLQPVADGLHDRFALLTRGRRTALPRHRTLRGVLDWSYQLLPDAEQRLLRHLAVFSGGFTGRPPRSWVMMSPVAPLSWTVSPTSSRSPWSRWTETRGRDGICWRRLAYTHSTNSPRMANATGRSGGARCIFAICFLGQRWCPAPAPSKTTREANIVTSTTFAPRSTGAFPPAGTGRSPLTSPSAMVWDFPPWSSRPMPGGNRWTC